MTMENKEPQEEHEKNASYLDSLTSEVVELPFRIGESIVKLIKSDSRSVQAISSDGNATDGLTHIFESVQDVVGDSVEQAADIVIKVAGAVGDVVGEVGSGLIDDIDV